MPLLVNSALGFLFKIEDDKPEKVCQWTECPNTKSGYKDSKMPMCARCKLVRYCSKECQRGDWCHHKKYCNTPPLLDIGAWMEEYNDLFRWTLIEALRLRSNPSNILKYDLWIQVVKHGRMMNGISPSPFAIDLATPLTWEDIEKYGGGADISTAQKSAKIISEGGIGEGVIIFNIRCRSPGGKGFHVCHMQYHHILDMPAGIDSPVDGAWKEIVKGTVNGDIPVAALSHMIE
ncbi:hypothetical protein C8J57DRAFT_1354490 [Mycena rebaudengoi]|nr:hypothetical protein C8J57DRAFT_1354490 [Mycena rebaudengoi]